MIPYHHTISSGQKSRFFHSRHTNGETRILLFTNVFHNWTSMSCEAATRTRSVVSIGGALFVRFAPVTVLDFSILKRNGNDNVLLSNKSLWSLCRRCQKKHLHCCNHGENNFICCMHECSVVFDTAVHQGKLIYVYKSHLFTSNATNWWSSYSSSMVSPFLS